MSSLLIVTVLLPVIISAILFLSWRRNENKNPNLSKLALTFAIIFLGIAIAFGIMWYVFSSISPAI